MVFKNNRRSSPCCSTCAAAAALALSATLLLASAPSPVAAIGVSPGGLSSFKITGGQEVAESFGVASAQNCLDSCFSNSNGCNAVSFCTGSGGCDGKAANTCVLYQVGDVFNPPGDASSFWMSGTIQQTQQQPSQQQQQDVVYQNNNGNNNNNVAGPVVAAAATAALTTAVIAEAGQHRGPVITPIVPIIVPIAHHKPLGGRKMLMTAVAA